MSREIEENAQSVFAIHSAEEILKAVESSMNDMTISSSDNPIVEEMLHSREDNSCMDGLVNPLYNRALRKTKASARTNSGCTNENFIEQVSLVDILQNKTDYAESRVDQGTSTQGQMSEPLAKLKKYSDVSDSSDNEDYSNIELKGLAFSGEGFDDDESVGSEDISGSEIDEEAQTTKVENINKKKKKVEQKDSWLSVLGIDKVSTDLPSISTLGLNNKEEFEHMGYLECVIDRIVTISGLPGMPAFDFDTLLFLEEGQKVLGYVLDIMGPVTAPVYIVPLNSARAKKDLQLTKGTKVYCAPKSKYTKYVFLQELMKVRGSSSSCTEDADLASELQEFSEDEHIKASRKETKRKCSQERFRKFVRDMNRANERNTRLHRMADVHRLHLERLAKNPGRTPQNQEARRSRPTLRNDSTLNDLQNWSLTTLNGLPTFDPSIPPPNYSGSRFYLPPEGSTFSSFVGLVHPQTAPSRGVDFEQRPSFRHNNMPGPSSETWFN